MIVLKNTVHPLIVQKKISLNQCQFCTVSQLLTATVCLLLLAPSTVPKTLLATQPGLFILGTSIQVFFLDAFGSHETWNIPKSTPFVVHCKSKQPVAGGHFSPGLCELSLLPQPPGGPRPRKQGKWLYPKGSQFIKKNKKKTFHKLILYWLFQGLFQGLAEKILDQSTPGEQTPLPSWHNERPPQQPCWPSPTVWHYPVNQT